ncbi:unnamed protein product [Closterium sp. Yama58-4]|nr:unnamed protein product [Closterium sp. Yama58-4]
MVVQPGLVGDTVRDSVRDRVGDSVRDSVRESGGIAVGRERVCGVIGGEMGGGREEMMEDGGTMEEGNAMGGLGDGDAMVDDAEGCMEGEEDEVGEDETADSWEEQDEEEEGDEDVFLVLVGSERQMRWLERGGGVEGGGGEKERLGSASMQFDRDAGTSHSADLAHGVWFRISTRALPAHVARLLDCLHAQPSNQLLAQPSNQLLAQPSNQLLAQPSNQLPAQAGVADNACGSAAPHAHPPVKTPEETPEEGGVIESKGTAGVLNLDVTAAVALVSELSHGGAQRIAGLAEPDLRARFGNTWQFMRDQAQAELAQPQLQLLQESLVNKGLIMCETAYKEFSSIVDVIAGPREKQRAAALFSSHVRVVPDQPSSRLLSLPSTARIKQRHVIIFGTADSWGCATLSASSAFVRAARHAGALVRVVEHRPCALMGE